MHGTCQARVVLQSLYDLLYYIVYYNYSCNIRVEGIVDAWNMSARVVLQSLYDLLY